jgi:hypothetical protein
MKIVNQLATFLLMVSAFEINSHAGIYTATPTPTAAHTDSTTGTQYVVISKTTSQSTGVNFQGGYTVHNGTVDSTLWNFQHGSPPTSYDTNPGKVTFSDDGWGVANLCTVGVKHTGSNGESCATTSKPVSKIYVNILKLSLAFNTASWSSDDTAPANAAGFSPSPPTIATLVAANYNGLICEVFPYEYKVTVQPANSYVTSTDLDINEAYSKSITYYTGTTAGTPATSTGSSTYRATGYICDAGGPAPTNPIMYAFDAPGPAKLATQAIMTASSYTKMVYSLVLTSTPLWKTAGDSAQAQSKTFTTICTADGHGGYTWSN